jgi:hypothetical protein
MPNIYTDLTVQIKPTLAVNCTVDFECNLEEGTLTVRGVSTGYVQRFDGGYLTCDYLSGGSHSWLTWLDAYLVKYVRGNDHYMSILADRARQLEGRW